MKNSLSLFALIISLNLYTQSFFGQNIDLDSLFLSRQNEYAEFLTDTTKAILQIIPCDNYFSNLLSDESDLAYAKYQIINAKNDTIKQTESLGDITLRLSPGKYKIIMDCLDTYHFFDIVELNKSTFTKINLMFDMALKNVIYKTTSVIAYDIIDFYKFAHGQTLEKSITNKH